MLHEEREEGRISALYDPADLVAIVGPIRNAPLTVAPKDGNYARGRVGQDFSDPCDDLSDISLKASLNMDDFTCAWGTFSRCRLLAASAPPGTVFDVKAAHRCIPVVGWQQAFYCIEWKGKVALNHCCQFGAASSSGLWGNLADAFRAIFAHFPRAKALNRRTT